MHRTQVSLTDKQIKALRQEAMRRGVSMAEVVRRRSRLISNTAYNGR